MKLDFKKAVWILIGFVTVTVFVRWYGFILPFSKFKTLVKEGPNWINEKIISKYPDDLKIEIKNSQVTINQKSPYCVIVGRDKKGIVYDEKFVGEVTAMDSDGIYSKLCNPVAIVSKNLVMYKKENGQYQINEIPKDINYSVTKTGAKQVVDDFWLRIVKFGQILYWIGPVLGVFILTAFFMVANLWYATVAKFFIKIFKIKKDISFKEIYSLTLFLYTIILTVGWIVFEVIVNNWLEGNFSLSFPFFNTILITLGSVLILREKKNK